MAVRSKPASGLRIHVPGISIADLNAAQGQLVALHGFLNSPDMNVAAKLHVEPAPSIDQIVTYGFADVGAWRFGALTKWRTAKQSVENGTLKLRLVERQIIERYAFEASDQSAAAAFEADFKRLANTPGALVMDDNAVARLIQ